jgi:hypothetical protein
VANYSKEENTLKRGQRAKQWFQQYKRRVSDSMQKKLARIENVMIERK